MVKIEDQRPDDLPDDFPDGSILRIVFHNFLTYSDATLMPRENLNLLIGYNGSGKSSIICGICLGLGGSPKLLGRSEKIGDYIRHGCQEGFVEIVLADKARGPQFVKLTLKQGRSPEYRLNNKPSSQKDVQEMCLRYNIQIGNPCAFLAQDKVKSFSEQSAIELLKNTLKAASQKLISQYDELLLKREEEATMEDKCELVQKKVAHLKAEITALEPRVENYRKKVAMEDKLRLYERKYAIVDYETTEIAYKSEAKKADKAKQEVEKARGEMRDLQSKKKKYSDEREKARKAADNAKQNVRHIRDQLDAQMDRNFIRQKLAAAQASFDEQKRMFDEQEEREQKLKDSIESFAEKIARAEKKLEGREEAEARSKKKVIELHKEEEKLRNVEEDISSKSRALEEMKRRLNEERQRFQQAFNVRLHVVESFSRDAGAAWKWYCQNRDQFRFPVFVPLLHLTLKDINYGPYVENSVTHRDLCMFICGCKDDELLLNDRSKGWRLNTAVIDERMVDPGVLDARLPEELRRVGFDDLVSNMFDAPAAVKQYLCNVFRLHMIPKGSDLVERHMDRALEVIKNLRYSRFLTPNISVSISFSKYSGEVNQQQSELRNAYLLANQQYARSPESSTSSKMQEKIDQMTEEVGKMIQSRSEKRKEWQTQMDVLNQEKSHWRENASALRTLRDNKEQMEHNLYRVVNNKPDLDQARINLEEEKRRASEDSMKRIRTFLDKFKRDIELHKEVALNLLVERQSRRREEAFEDKIDAMNDVVKDQEDTAKTVEIRFREKHAECMQKLNNLKDKCGLPTLDVDKMDRRQKEIFEKLNDAFAKENVPFDLKELEAAIEAETKKLRIADDNVEGTAKDEDKMEELKRSLLEQEERSKQLQTTRSGWQEKLKESIEKWRVPIEEMIEKINENYSKFFTQMGCTGEVHLDIPENPLDVQFYGIMIMVCFREGERMKRLDQKSQSGGERSVATMLYLLALQQLCHVPFRCVDEINQGMDPTNERKVFDIMIDTLSGGGELAKSQYFLLTPKLLNDLHFNEKVTVQIVHNFMPSVGPKWNTDSFIDNIKKRVALAK